MICLSDCKTSDTHSMKIDNQSARIIDSVVVKTRKIVISFPSIEPGASARKHYTVDEKYNSEDSFFASFYLKDTIITIPTFGYYPNTADIQDEIMLVIDSQLVVREKSQRR
jgi:hypothetical protein